MLDTSVKANDTVAPGNEITLTVRTGEKTKLASCDLYIYYDKDQLTYVSGSGKTLTTSEWHHLIRTMQAKPAVIHGRK